MSGISKQSADTMGPLSKVFHLRYALFFIKMVDVAKTNEHTLLLPDLFEFCH